MAIVPTQVQDNVPEVEVIKEAKLPVIKETTAKETVVPAVVTVLSRYRVEKVGENDAHVYERIVLPSTYANEPGIHKFVGLNGRITYYAEKLVKKYSENVVTT